MQVSEVTGHVLELCRSLGFGSAGVARARVIDYGDELVEWLEEGKQGEMAWLGNHRELRIDPGEMLAGCRSVVVVADWYAAGGENEGGENSEREGRIARYARGDDYHLTMKKRLIALCVLLRKNYPEESFRAAVDTAPVMEREHGARAGLGFVGKNTLLIEPGVGSYFFLGEILTTMELVESGEVVTDHCGSCTRCIDACPTDAITPYSVDARRCISYLTIEHRSLIDEKYHEAMGDWIFGCDICQEVCPHNGGGGSGGVDGFDNGILNVEYTPRRAGFDLLEVLGWDEEERRAAFSKSAMKRAKLWMMKRNALIAAGNYLRDHDDVVLRERISELAGDDGEEEIVRETARRVAVLIGMGD